MITHIKAAKSLQASISLPSSKSYSIRSFIIAARGGRSFIHAPSDCDDAKVALAVARQLGSRVTRKSKQLWLVEAGRLKKRTAVFDVGESGTVLRLLLPLLPAQAESARVTGHGTLRGRPNNHLLQTLRSQGLRIRGAGRNESIPIRFEGGILKGGRIEIDGSLSSQFISALLIACPSIDKDSTIVIKGRKLVSQDYITMTELVLRAGGIKLTKVNSRKFSIKGSQEFRGLKKFITPADYGLAAYFIVAAALVKSRLTLAGHFNDKFVQADGRIISLARKMGVRFRKDKAKIKISGPFSLKGGSFSLKNSPDLVPVMAVLALFARGRTRLYGIKHARAKESDRISDLRKELLKAGAKVSEKPDEIIIYPQKEYKRDALLDSHRDHRLAMAFSVLGLKIGCRIKNINCVSKSYPGFVRDLRKLRR